MMIIVLND